MNHCYLTIFVITREFPTPPSGGLIPPTFAQHPPASGGKERGKGKGKGRGEGKGPPRVG